MEEDSQEPKTTRCGGKSEKEEKLGKENGTEQLEDMCEGSVLRLTGDGIAADKKLLHMMPNSSQRWEVIVSTADKKNIFP